MKQRWFRALTALATLGWMAMIFGFSAQTGEESGGLSAIIAEPVTTLIAEWCGLEETEALYLQVDGVVRAAAHFCEYAILGGLLLIATQPFGMRAYWLAWLIGVVYAILDEWHQSFSPGRVCDPKDVLIDACGVLCGVLLTHWTIKIWRKKHVYHQ